MYWSAFLCNFSHERKAPALRFLLLLSSLSSNTTKIRTLVRPRGGSRLGLYEQAAWTRLLPFGDDAVCTLKLTLNAGCSPFAVLPYLALNNALVSTMYPR